MKDENRTSSHQVPIGSEPTARFCPSAGLLDVWSDQEWTHGVQVDKLQVLDRVFVRTANSLYELTVLTPSSGEVLVRGGTYFQNVTIARVAGSSLGGSFLKVRGIYEGFQLELVEGDSTIITGRVQKVATSS